MMDAILKYSMMEAGQRRIDAWLREQGLFQKCRVGVVGIYGDTGDFLIARAKVIVPGVGSFEHEERPYLSFPSDHFKTKVLLATGG